MSGHSKWKTNKSRKTAADAKKGAAYTKIIKEITINDLINKITINNTYFNDINLSTLLIIV